MRALAHAIVAALLLMPLSAALPLAAPPGQSGWPGGLRILLEPGREPVIGFAPAPQGGGNPNASECQIFAPMELECEGNEVLVENAIHIGIGIGLESASNSWVHIVQEVGGKPVFAGSFKTNLTHWLVPYLLMESLNLFEVRVWGVPQWNTLTSVRLDVSYLPAAGEVTAGGWHAYLGPTPP